MQVVSTLAQACQALGELDNVASDYIIQRPFRRQTRSSHCRMLGSNATHGHGVRTFSKAKSAIPLTNSSQGLPEIVPRDCDSRPDDR